MTPYSLCLNTRFESTQQGNHPRRWTPRSDFDLTGEEMEISPLWIFGEHRLQPQIFPVNHPEAVLARLPVQVGHLKT